MKVRQAEKIVFRYFDDVTYKPRKHTLLRAACVLIPSSYNSDTRRLERTLKDIQIINTYIKQPNGAAAYLAWCNSVPNTELAS